jgi:hypothetical protein
MTEQEDTKNTRPGEQAVVRTVCAVAFLAVAASLYGKAFPGPAMVEVRASVLASGGASDTCVPLQAPKYTFGKEYKSGKTLVNAWVSYQECVDPAEAAQSVRSLIAEKMTADGIGEYGLSVEFYDTDRPFRSWSLKYTFAHKSQLGV